MRAFYSFFWDIKYFVVFAVFTVFNIIHELLNKIHAYAAAFRSMDTFSNIRFFVGCGVKCGAPHPTGDMVNLPFTGTDFDFYLFGCVKIVGMFDYVGIGFINGEADCHVHPHH